MKQIKTLLFQLSIIFVYLIIFFKIWPIFLIDAQARYLLLPIGIWIHCSEFFLGVIISVLILGLDKISFNYKYIFLFTIFQFLAISSDFTSIFITLFPLSEKYVAATFQIFAGIYFIRSFLKLNQ